ncbi:MAG: DUF6268 family outer membrane beta-barrel protein [Gemmataceae bacterium]
MKTRMTFGLLVSIIVGIAPVQGQSNATAVSAFQNPARSVEEPVRDRSAIESPFIQTPVISSSDPQRSVPALSTLETTPTSPPATQANAGAFNARGMAGLGGGMGGAMGGFGSNGGPGYMVTWSPQRPVSGTNDSLWLVRQSANAGVPLYLEGSDTLFVTTSVRNTQIGSTATLPDSKQLFPSDLWSISLGLRGTHKLENGWTVMGMTSFGSASDQPFASIREMNVTLLGAVMIPARNERDLWLVSVMYNPAGNLNFPIPGLAYVWNPNESLRINIGIPFSVEWKPTDDLTLNASYFPLTNITTRATYRIAPKLFAYAGYEFLNEAYFLRDRINDRDRFMLFEQRLIVGVRYNLTQSLALDTNAGYSFGRYFAEGINQGGSQTDRVDVAPGAFLGLALRGRF